MSSHTNHRPRSLHLSAPSSACISPGDWAGPAPRARCWPGSSPGTVYGPSWTLAAGTADSTDWSTSPSAGSNADTPSVHMASLRAPGVSLSTPGNGPPLETEEQRERQAWFCFSAPVQWIWRTPPPPFSLVWACVWVWKQAPPCRDVTCSGGTTILFFYTFYFIHWST